MAINKFIRQNNTNVVNTIQGLARTGIVDQEGAPLGTRKKMGYVCDIHLDDDEEEELRGTIDVQEFGEYAEDNHGDAVGYHEGVMLSAIPGNENGIRIIPQLYSLVVFVQDPVTLEEYVIMFTSAQKVQLNATENISMGVTGYEEFNETEDGLEKDYDELEETGEKTRTIYTKDKISHSVTKDDEGVVEETTAENKTISVGDTKVTINGSEITIETSSQISLTIGNTKITADSSSATVNAQSVTITGGKLIAKGVSSTDLQGPFNAIKVCPFSGAPHCGSNVSGT